MKRRSFFKSFCQAVAVATVAPMVVAQVISLASYNNLNYLEFQNALAQAAPTGLAVNISAFEIKSRRSGRTEMTFIL